MSSENEPVAKQQGRKSWWPASSFAADLVKEAVRLKKRRSSSRAREINVKTEVTNRARAGCFKKETWSGRFLSACFSLGPTSTPNMLEWAAPVFRGHFHAVTDCDGSRFNAGKVGNQRRSQSILERFWSADVSSCNHHRQIARAQLRIIRCRSRRIDNHVPSI